ncbi:probable LRR receptor-like serine/threonine-protein kinase At2g16250 [Lolium rigidum]|uniref:probable LRR receptor-like serine/threonine-protein kinase At2g16250 n=1 Tax=Lolium rigidum TaxID=89674 RepID=UPI001F5C249F|nr:probable LRR receptor-like serine/threonine-protein kinase At2g16250 [Lolium rigidum]
MMRARGLCAAPLLLLLFLAAAPPGPAHAQQGRLTSRADLAGLYLLRGSLGLRARDWPRRADPCTAWTGITCRGGRVVALTLAGLRRTRLGRLAPRFAVEGLRNLSRLESLTAAGFPLPGPIPRWLGAGLAPSFQALDLSACAVTGEIAAEALAGLANLTSLSLAGNLLSGPLPAAALAGLARLTTLNLSGNAFSGALPDAVWSLPQLRILDVSRTNLTGALPSPLVPSPNLQAVDLSGNLFYGAVPDSFSQLFTRLATADISGNYFEGNLTAAGNVSSAMNCFLDVAGQRTLEDCQQFYAGHGLPYAGPVPAPAPPAGTKSKKPKNLKYILIGAIGGGVLLLAVVAAIVFCVVCSGRRRNDQRESGSPSAPPPGVQGSSRAVTAAAAGGTQPTTASPTNTVKVGDSFAYDQLADATSGFADERIIKHGHSGDLYYGLLQDGTTVVVKRITSRVTRKEAYMTELDLFGKGLHQRLVPFVGHCLDKEDEKVLVYRFVRNGDLSSSLHRKQGEEEEGMQSLDWIKRLKIATGVAEALCYLHHECTPPMVHRDVQASSILLDDKFEVRLGSLSEVCPQEGESHQNVITKLLRFSSTADQGSSGSPSATCSYDVYCFGKVLLELVTGRLGISASSDSKTSDWLDNTLRYINIYEKELMSKIIDPSLIIDEDHLEEVWAMAIVAKSCLNPRSSKRPPMKYILKALENPLKVVREDNGSSSARLRATSSRGSWNAAFFGSWRHSSSEIGPSRDDHMFKRSETIKSSGGSNGEHSSSRRRQSKEIFPEPSGSRDTED